MSAQLVTEVANYSVNMALNFLQATDDTANATTYTFSSQNLGTAATDRNIIVAVGSKKAGSATTISSVTIGGVSATILKQDYNSSNNTSITGVAMATVPTGTTGDIVVTFSDSMLRARIGVWSYNGSLTLLDSGSSTATAPTYDINVGKDGFVIATSASGTSTSTTWTELTEKYDGVIESYATFSGASKEYTTDNTGVTCTSTFGSAVAPVAVFVSLEPSSTETTKNPLFSFGGI